MSQYSRNHPDEAVSHDWYLGGRRVKKGESIIRFWCCDYEYQGRLWRTVIEAVSRDQAMRQFRRDNPGVELKECF